MENCPFCKEEVTTIAFASENGFAAIYNHAPIVPGHSLIIPLNHTTDVMTLTQTEYVNLFLFARKVMKFLNEYFGTNEFDISLQQGENAGQSVDHVHLHLIPRKYMDLTQGEEWYHKLSEDDYRSLDSDKILKSRSLKIISEKLKKAWEESMTLNKKEGNT